MSGFAAGSLVILHASNPKERLWGVIKDHSELGVVLRGIALDSIDDWIYQTFSEGGTAMIGLTTVFIPTHRLERVFLDESSGGAEGIADRIAERYGVDVREYLESS